MTVGTNHEARLQEQLKLLRRLKPFDSIAEPAAAPAGGGLDRYRQDAAALRATANGLAASRAEALAWELIATTPTLSSADAWGRCTAGFPSSIRWRGSVGYPMEDEKPHG